jgi:hypothetical protein
MTRKTDTELLIRILDTYCSGVTNSLGTVAAMNGVSFKSIYTWLRDETIRLDYMGEVDITFGRAMNMARNVAKALTISRSLEDRVLNGLKVQVWHHGEPSYLDDEEAVTATKEEFETGLDLGYFWPDRKKRVRNPDTGVFERVIATRIEAPPAQLVEVYARANMPSIYGAKSEVTMKGNVNLGVTTGAQRPLPPEVQALIAPQAITETTMLLTAVDGAEVYAPDSLDDILGPDPLASPGPDPLATTDTPPDVFEPEGAALPEPATPEPVMIRDTATIPPQWRTDWAALQAKLSSPAPDKINRRA